MSHISAKFVLRKVSVYAKLKEQVADDPEFISHTVIGDESWIYGYDPENKSSCGNANCQIDHYQMCVKFVATLSQVCIHTKSC